MISNIFDPVRKRWVAATPEELVRQRLLGQLLEMGVPIHRCLVEVGLAKLFPHMQMPWRGSRRLDLAITEPGSSSLLLIAECKAGPVTERALSQVIAYQSVVQARYILVATPNDVWTWSAVVGQNAHQGWVYGMPSKSDLGL